MNNVIQLKPKPQPILQTHLLSRYETALAVLGNISTATNIKDARKLALAALVVLKHEE